MEMALTFNDTTLTPITRQNCLWIRAAELARALGYAREDKITRLYQRNADEFTSEMTQIIEIVDTPTLERSTNLKNFVRIFSLRGCHLLAMFARTPVAKAFRRWVLDVLDRLAAEERARIADNVKSLSRKRGRPAMARPAAPGPAAFTRSAMTYLEEADIELRALNRDYNRRKDQIVKLLMKAVTSCVREPGGQLAIMDALYDKVAEAAIYPDNRGYIPDHAMPHKWLHEIIPAMMGKGA